jgi:DNA polymerase I
VLTVHDELVFEIPDAEVAIAIPKIESEMRGAADLRVPLLVHVGQGLNWGECK